MKKLITFLMMVFAVAIVSCADKTDPNTGVIPEEKPEFTETDFAALDDITIAADGLATVEIKFMDGEVYSGDMNGSIDKPKSDVATAFETAIKKSVDDDSKLNGYVDVSVILDEASDKLTANKTTAVATLTLKDGATMATGAVPSLTFTFTPGAAKIVPNITTAEFEALKAIDIAGIATANVTFDQDGIATPPSPAGSTTKTKDAVKNAFDLAFTTAINDSGVEAIKKSVTVTAEVTKNTGGDTLDVGAVEVTVKFVLADGATIDNVATTPVIQVYKYTASSDGTTPPKDNITASAINDIVTAINLNGTDYGQLLKPFNDFLHYEKTGVGAAASTGTASRANTKEVFNDGQTVVDLREAFFTEYNILAAASDGKVKSIVNVTDIVITGVADKNAVIIELLVTPIVFTVTPVVGDGYVVDGAPLADIVYTYTTSKEYISEEEAEAILNGLIIKGGSIIDTNGIKFDGSRFEFTSGTTFTAGKTVSDLRNDLIASWNKLPKVVNGVIGSLPLDGTRIELDFRNTTKDVALDTVLTTIDTQLGQRGFFLFKVTDIEVGENGAYTDAQEIGPIQYWFAPQ